MTERMEQVLFPGQDEEGSKQEAIANVTGLRVLSAIGAAVPVRLMKRDLLFIVERLTSLLEEPRLQMLARQHGIREKRVTAALPKQPETKEPAKWQPKPAKKKAAA